MSTSNNSQKNDSKVNVRILLASFWISQFLLWSFGDMLTILQEMGEPITETVIMVIAPSLAIIQTLMIVYSLSGNQKYARWLNLGVPVIFLLFNVQYIMEATQIWNYILGAAYVMYDLLIIWFAWKWRDE